jgi:protein-disulfide isomerase
MPGTTSRPNRAASWRTVFEVSSTLTLIILATILVWQGRWGPASSSAARSRSALDVPATSISIAQNPKLGASRARIAIVEYSDFECPYCGAVARETLPTVIREYVDTEKVVLVFKNLPLPMHGLARHAAAAALCADQQGRFWQMHDRMFAAPMRLTGEDLRASAVQVGIDLRVFDSCLDGSASSSLVDRDLSEARELRVTGTPTFIFGRIQSDGRVYPTHILTGARPFLDFQRVLEELLD